jgi:monoamine oxidase
MLATSRGDFRADRAIVTVPLGVLQREAIGFDPPLPDEKLEAIGWLGVGTLNKIALRFRESFWPGGAQSLGYLNGRPDETLEFWNASYTGAPILVAYAGGSFARAIENLPEGEAVDLAMDHLRAMFGTAAPDPRAVVRTRWASEAYAGGSYSYLAPGSGRAHRISLARPVGDQLFFAGEATSGQYAGTVHGALLSGREAARQILRLSRRRKERGRGSGT